jgi:imidazolonepropionase-like amidohydrolase
VKRVFFAAFLAVAASGSAFAQGDRIVLATDLILDGAGNIIRDTNIVVEGSKIVGTDSGADLVTYDLRGLTVLPGLIDTHIHLNGHFEPDGRAHGPESDETAQELALYSAENAYAMLMAGFTTAQSVASPYDIEVRDAIARGRMPGPRILTAIESISAATGGPEQIAAFVRQLATDGADVIKVFGSESVRDGGDPTLTDAQMKAACGTAAELGLRSVVHAHGSESIRSAILAGCTGIEHGSSMSDEVIDLLISRGTYWDPHFGLVIENYMSNKDRYLGIGNFTEEGFTSMSGLVPVVIDTMKRALARGGAKIVYGTDAVAGALGRNQEELIYRVRDAGQDPMEALVSAGALAAESLNLGT